MLKLNELRLPNQSLTNYLEAVSKVSIGSITSVTEDMLSTLVASPDNTLILYAELLGIESGFTRDLNIPDLKKLSRVLENVNSKIIEFTVGTNNIQYKSPTLKFKYHLYEEGFLTKTPINVEKIKSFTYDVKFTLSKAQIQAIIKGSAYSTESNKLYVYTEDGRLKGELTDRAKHNVDALSLDLGEVPFTLAPIPINLDNFKLLTILNNEISFSINTDYGVSIIDIQNDEIKLKYILTSLTE